MPRDVRPICLFPAWYRLESALVAEVRTRQHLEQSSQSHRRSSRYLPPRSVIGLAVIAAWMRRDRRLRSGSPLRSSVVRLLRRMLLRRIRRAPSASWRGVAHRGPRPGQPATLTAGACSTCGPWWYYTSRASHAPRTTVSGESGCRSSVLVCFDLIRD